MSDSQKAKKFSLSDGAVRSGILSKKARNQHGFNLMNPWAERKIALHEKCIVYGDLDAANAKDGVPLNADSVVMNTTLDNKPFAFKVMTPNPDSRISIDFIEVNLNASDDESRTLWVDAITGVINGHKRVLEEEKAVQAALVTVQSALACEKKLSTGVTYCTRYCWVDLANKTFNWSKVNDMTAGKSIPCRGVQSVVASVDGCGFSISLRDPSTLPPNLFSSSMFASLPTSIDIRFPAESAESLRLRDAFIAHIKDLRTARAGSV
jgi:hypothetical protein